MIKNLAEYGQYKEDIFLKLDFDFIPKKKILDIGCGDCTDANIFIKEYELDMYGIDIYKHKNVNKISGLKFKKAGIYNIPFNDSSFDYIFLHDVLHHIDEPKQRYEKHLEALNEVKRICKKGGYIMILEGNRYNPLFYPHMVKMLGHNHFKQSYFIRIVNDVFSQVTFKYFEAHFYPRRFLRLWKIYEKIMESIIPKRFLAYNVSIIKK